jgi:hypothetical protein
MKNFLFALATLFLVTLLMVPLSEAQVNFRMVEVPASPPPHDIGSTFVVQFVADASAIAPDTIRTISLYVQITGDTVDVANPAAPFTSVHERITFVTANEVDGLGNLLFTGLSPPTAGGIPGEDNLVIAEVELIQTVQGPSRLCYLIPTDPPGTRYSLASAPSVPIVPTPGEVQCVDVCLPVELAAFTVASADKGVVVKWRTESELNNLGFDVYRSESLDGTFTKVNQTRIAGAGTDGTPHSYRFTDENVEVGQTYYYYIEDISYNGERHRSYNLRVTVDATGKLKVRTPSKFALLQNFPNPFNPETWIPYQLAKDASVMVRIYNLKGQPIRIVALGQQAAGTYLTKDKAIYWDGRDYIGEKVASGVYFYTLQAGDFKATKRMVIVE